MKVVTPEGYTFITKFQEDNSHKVLRSVDFFSIKFDDIFFDTVCWLTSQFNKTSFIKHMDSILVIYHWYGFSGNTFVSSYPQQLESKVTERNTCDARQCMALLITFFDNPIWIRINCDAVYH